MKIRKGRECHDLYSYRKPYDVPTGLVKSLIIQPAVKSLSLGYTVSLLKLWRKWLVSMMHVDDGCKPHGSHFAA
jgi:hypothetical protein